MAEPLRVGLIGAGGISRQHLPGYQLDPERVRLAAVCDIREEAAQEFASEAEIDASAIFTDAREMCELADIDAVDICTIHDTHAELAIAAAEAGKHVLLEKPMAISVDECRAIVEATEAAGVTFMVAQHLRHVPSYVALRRRIQAGELGRIWSARTDTFLTAALEDPNQPIAMPPGWWGFDGKRGGGGVVTLLSVHHLDLMRFFVGEVVRVEARAWRGHPSFHQRCRGPGGGDAGVRQRGDRHVDGEPDESGAVAVPDGDPGRSGSGLDAAAGGEHAADVASDTGGDDQRAAGGRREFRSDDELPAGRHERGVAADDESVRE